MLVEAAMAMFMFAAVSSVGMPLVGGMPFCDLYDQVLAALDEPASAQ